MVEIEHVGCDHLAALGSGKRELKPFVQQHAIWQVRQRVVQRHVRDLRFRLAPVRDVFRRRYQSSIRHAPMLYGEDPAVRQFLDLRGSLGHISHLRTNDSKSMLPKTPLV